MLEQREGFAVLQVPAERRHLRERVLGGEPTEQDGAARRAGGDAPVGVGLPESALDAERRRERPGEVPRGERVVEAQPEPAQGPSALWQPPQLACR
jgi:hypothetical protein